ncbi:MAG: hypothetical protein K0S76_1988 [Herbinix sp.]|jgi:hypothetical protein|nr:hypothetical protein [Herbinix sp.]
MYLIPSPKKVTGRDGETFILRYNSRIVIAKECDLKVTSHAKLLKQDIKDKLGFTLDITKGESENNCILISIKSDLQSEEYNLHISPQQIEIIGGSNAGILYAIQTIRQLIETEGAILPCVMIEDSPDIKNRGFYHDVTRGRIPTLTSLKALADKLAYYKMNQLQLYIEHSFLFKDFSEVWRDDTPLTAEEILELDAYCKNLHIDLIPSIASFGHLYKVLRTKTYTNVCELPDADKEHFSFYERMAHHTLDISREDSYVFVTKMLEEYMPLFSSEYFNLCADETFDLGKGKSEPLADKVGVDTMYVDFLKRLCDFVIAKDKCPMFWGDIICQFPEAIQKLPGEVICLNWGYAPNQDERTTKIFAEEGAVQYVCPGVHGWNNYINNLWDAYENISRMSSYGVKYQAAGLLNTDWGDFGHINHPEFSTAGLIYGAAFSWNGKIPAFDEINRKISRLEYGDHTEQFLSIISEVPKKSVATWFEIVCFKEVRQKSIKGKPWAPVLEDINFRKVQEANQSLEEMIHRIYGIHSKAKTEKRYLYEAYLTVIEGIKLWNEVGAAVVCEERNDEFKTLANRLAVRLEYWYREYQKLWLSVSKESELYRIGELVFWYCDNLRDLAMLD